VKNIILGVTGSIAAYKAADITNKLVKNGFDVHVVMTEGATKFIAPLTFQSLSGNKVSVDIFQEKEPSEIKHINLSQQAHAFLIAPITANVIGKLASGIADDMLTCLGLSTHGIPKIIAPAMNTRMYENSIVQENIEKLKKHGYKVIEPRTSRLACGIVGKGALADVDDIINCVLMETKVNEKNGD